MIIIKKRNGKKILNYWHQKIGQTVRHKNETMPMLISAHMSVPMSVHMPVPMSVPMSVSSRAHVRVRRKTSSFWDRSLVKLGKFRISWTVNPIWVRHFILIGISTCSTFCCHSKFFENSNQCKTADKIFKKNYPKGNFHFSDLIL